MGSEDNEDRPYWKIYLTLIQYFMLHMFIKIYFMTPEEEPEDESTAEPESNEPSVDPNIREPNTTAFHGIHTGTTRRRGNRNNFRSHGNNNPRTSNVPARQEFDANGRPLNSRKACSCTLERFREYRDQDSGILAKFRGRPEPEVMLERAEAILSCSMRDMERHPENTVDGMEVLDDELFVEFIRM